MASLNQQRFHVVTLLLIVAFVISSALGTSLSRNFREQKELKKPGTNQTVTPSSYLMENENFTAVAVTETPSITTPSILKNTSDSTNSTLTNTTLASSSPISDTSETAGSKAPLEAEHVAWHTEDLLFPAPKSVHLLAQLMALSMSQIDTAFRGSSQRNQSVSIQYNKSFRTTMLQISQKLNNALLLASTNSETIATSLLNAPGKLEEAFNYLKKFKNSSRNANFLILPLKSLKDTTDQTINLSSQVVSQLSGLVRLADEIIEAVDSSKTEKEQQREAVFARLQSTQTEKSKIENKTFVIEKVIEQLKREVRLHKMDSEIVIEDLKNLRSKANDESRCYWSFNQKEKLELYYCPYRPESTKIREAEKAKEAPQKLFESAMKRLDEKEELARDHREKDNKLLIRMKKLFADKGQLAGDIQLLEKSRTLFTGLVGNFTMLERSWASFAGICKDIQEGAAKSHATVVETIENPSRWNNTLSDKLAEQLKDTQENLSLLKTIVQSYLEGYARHIVEMVAEAEQMMTKRGHPQELERLLLRKCELASGEIQKFIQSNSQLREADSQIAQRIKIIK
ncbi:uncharacterized protein LOC124312992 isoform X2 [Daphnia pulicaria]|uniref:uncharacterized protein LOC124312992 isoform X2 n=1 Tax=Daphnia pulicaria TaxID=35523 RepID=UPI001EEA0E0C|nr:uncharacterized protein LOC124312992 isoform X2 [Daphnia pulicaria]